MIDQEKPALDELAHFGVKGMKWGIRRDRSSGGGGGSSSSGGGKSGGGGSSDSYSVGGRQFNKAKVKKVAAGAAVGTALVGGAFLAYKLNQSGGMPMSSIRDLGGTKGAPKLFDQVATKQQKKMVAKDLRGMKRDLAKSNRQNQRGLDKISRGVAKGERKTQRGVDRELRGMKRDLSKKNRADTRALNKFSGDPRDLGPRAPLRNISSPGAKGRNRQVERELRGLKREKAVKDFKDTRALNSISRQANRQERSTTRGVNRELSGMKRDLAKKNRADTRALNKFSGDPRDLGPKVPLRKISSPGAAQRNKQVERELGGMKRDLAKENRSIDRQLKRMSSAHTKNIDKQLNGIKREQSGARRDRDRVARRGQRLARSA